MVNPSGKPDIGCPEEMMNASPLKMVIVASVTIMGGIFTFVTHMPLNTPMTPQITMHIIHDKNALNSILTIIYEHITLINAI